LLVSERSLQEESVKLRDLFMAPSLQIEDGKDFDREKLDEEFVQRLIGKVVFGGKKNESIGLDRFRQ